MQRRPLILLALCLAAFVISVDVTIVNVALPTLVRSLGASTTQLQWVVDAYSLVFAALVLAAGSLSDRYGRKGTLLIGLGVFALASLAGAISATTGELIAARAVMGLGAALMFPSTLSLLVNVFTERGDRAKAIGLWGATTGVGIAMGPIVGGWLLERFAWGSIFVFMTIVAAAIAVLVAGAVPTSRNPSTPPLDWRGLVLSTAGMAFLVLGVIEAPDWGWGSAASVASLALGGLLLAVFVLVEGRIEHPMLDVALFRNPRFTAASVSVAVSFFALSGFIFLVTQYFQFVKDFTPLGTGVRLLPVAASVGITSVVGTKLAVRVGNKAVVGTGLLLFGHSPPVDLDTDGIDVLWRHCSSDARAWFRDGTHERTGHRGDHGSRSRGQGGRGLSGQRRDTALRRHARCGHHRQPRCLFVCEPTWLRRFPQRCLLVPSPPPKVRSAGRSSPPSSSRSSVSIARHRGSPTPPRMRFSTACLVVAASREASPSPGPSWRSHSFLLGLDRIRRPQGRPTLSRRPRLSPSWSRAR